MKKLELEDLLPAITDQSTQARLLQLLLQLIIEPQEILMKTVHLEEFNRDKILVKHKLTGKILMTQKLRIPQKTSTPDLLNLHVVFNDIRLDLMLTF